jgi:hypothetical protein
MLKSDDVDLVADMPGYLRAWLIDHVQVRDREFFRFWRGGSD